MAQSYFDLLFDSIGLARDCRRAATNASGVPIPIPPLARPSSIMHVVRRPLARVPAPVLSRPARLFKILNGSAIFRQL